MAMKPCRECGHEVSTQADACPNCGAKKPASSMSEWQRTGAGCLGCFGLMIVFAMLFAYGGNGSSDSGNDVRSVSSMKSEAVVICHQFVKRRLKSPSTADFPFRRSSTVVALAGNRYQHEGPVDSQNSFGATVRSTFDCTVEHDPSEDSWTLVSLTVE